MSDNDKTIKLAAISNFVKGLADIFDTNLKPLKKSTKKVEKKEAKVEDTPDKMFEKLIKSKKEEEDK